MATPFGVRSWLWVMAHINYLYGQTFAKRSGRLWVTQWPYPWKNGSNKFLQQRRGDCSASDWALPVAPRKLPQLPCGIFDEASQMGTKRISTDKSACVDRFQKLLNHGRLGSWKLLRTPNH